MTSPADPLGIDGLHSTERRWQSWLDVEAALARAQADLGLIPAEAAAAIARAARVGALDRARIEDGLRRTGHALVPLVWELARAAGPEAGGWVHWGATSQNVMQTGDLLVLRTVHERLLGAIAGILTRLAAIAEGSADLAIAGRTHGQHAVPTTFGFKVAGWIDELLRHVDRLREAEPRVFVVLFGGAVGTFASFGDEGAALQERIARALGMGAMRVPSRAIVDHLAEYIALLGLLAGTCGRIVRELYTLMKTEYGEVEEPVPDGTVGSSTMPQKRNPHLLQDVIVQTAIVRSAVVPALEAMQTEHEADRGMNLLMNESLERACRAAGAMLAGLDVVLAGLTLHSERMRANLGLTGGLIVAEALMMRLAETTGRQRAHEIVHEAAQRASETGEPFEGILARAPEVLIRLTPEEVRGMLDPARYLGESARLARESAERARAGAERAYAPTVRSWRTNR